MPLQGVWTADDGCLPPWKGDYHNDLNTQLCYSHFFKANHLEEGESFLDFLWRLRPEAARFAKEFYGTDGICLPGVMTIDGKPLGGWPMYSLSPTQQIWLCQSFDLYYQYTGDRRFLAEKAWVYLRETALCITELLQLGEDGKYYLPVSSSPEIHDDEAKAWVTPNSNYDLALLRYLYQRLTDYAKELGLEKERLRWEQILERLPELAVDERGVLLLAPDEALRESHRHLSNAMAICPLRLIGYETPEERRIVDAVIADYRTAGHRNVGWFFLLLDVASLCGAGDGEGHWSSNFWESFCSVNGFHLNGDYKNRGYSSFHYRPFTLEKRKCMRRTLGNAAPDAGGADTAVSGSPAGVEKEGTGVYRLSGSRRDHRIGRYGERSDRLFGTYRRPGAGGRCGGELLKGRNAGAILSAEKHGNGGLAKEAAI